MPDIIQTIKEFFEFDLPLDKNSFGRGESKKPLTPTTTAKQIVPVEVTPEPAKKKVVKRVVKKITKPKTKR